MQVVFNLGFVRADALDGDGLQHRIICQRVNQFLFRFNFFGRLTLGKYACRRKAEHHT